MITAVVVKECQGKDGGAPGDDFLTDPEACGFHPAELLCKSADAPDCLTQEQVDAVTSMYGGARDPRTGEQIYYGWPKGSENSGRVVKTLPGWSLYWADPVHPDRLARLNFWKIWAFQESPIGTGASSSRRASITARADRGQTFSTCRAPWSAGSSRAPRPRRSRRLSTATTSLLKAR